jgi:AmmeMemoRadiSam system protein B
MFYPAETATLERTVSGLLGEAPPGDVNAKAIIAPHAGYQYSGPTAAYAYRLLEGRAARTGASRLSAGYGVAVG